MMRLTGWSGVFCTGTDMTGACSRNGSYGTKKDGQSPAHHVPPCKIARGAGQGKKLRRGLIPTGLSRFKIVENLYLTGQQGSENDKTTQRGIFFYKCCGLRANCVRIICNKIDGKSGIDRVVYVVKLHLFCLIHPVLSYASETGLEFLHTDD